MGARVATNVKLEVQSTIGSATAAATGITLANPGVVTVTHAFAAGDYLICTSIDGMVELDGQMVRVANPVSTTSFELEGIDTSTYTAMVASSTTFKKITAFTTLSNATNLTMPDGQPAKLDATRLISKRKEYLYGLPDAPDGAITTVYDPQITAVSRIKTATKANTALGFKITWSNGYKTIFNAYVSGGQGFEASQNQVVTANVAFTPIADLVEYTS